MPRTLTNTAPEAVTELGDPLDLLRQIVDIEDELKTLTLFDSPLYLIEAKAEVLAQARRLLETEGR